MAAKKTTTKKPAARKPRSDKGTNVARGGEAAPRAPEHKSREDVRAQEGWIKHDGKGCRLPAGTVVSLKRRSGHLDVGVKIGPLERRHGSTWNHNGIAIDDDVIEYRIIKPAAEPSAAAQRAPLEAAEPSAARAAHMTDAHGYDKDAGQPPVQSVRTCLYGLAALCIVLVLTVIVGVMISNKHTAYQPANMPATMSEVAAILALCERETGGQCVLTAVEVAKHEGVRE